MIPHAKGFVGNPQIFRELSGQTRLLLAVIGTPCAVYSSTDAAGPWVCANISSYNNPTLVPRPDGSVVLFCHDCAHDRIAWGDSASGVLGEIRTIVDAAHFPQLTFPSSRSALKCAACLVAAICVC